MKNKMLVLGFLTLIVAGAWKIVISPSYEQRLSPGWIWEYDTLGTWAYIETEADFDTSLENDEVANSTFKQWVDETTFSLDNALVLSEYQDVDPLTGEVDFSYTDQTTVNPVTGYYLDPELSDYRFVFPRNTADENYVLWDTYYDVMTFEFAGERRYGDLLTYEFSFTPELLDETESYVADEYIEEGQAVGCLDTQISYFVEPVTGEIVNINETCPREYYLDPETREPIAPYGRWEVLGSGDSIQRRVAVVQSMKNTYLLMTLYIPSLLAIGGIFIMAGGFFLKKPSMMEQS